MPKEEYLMLRTNTEKLIKISVMGEIASPTIINLSFNEIVFPNIELATLLPITTA